MFLRADYSKGFKSIKSLLLTVCLLISLFAGIKRSGSAAAYKTPEHDASVHTFIDDFRRIDAGGIDPLENGWVYGTPGRGNGAYNGTKPAVRIEDEKLVLDNLNENNSDFMRTRVMRPQSEARLNQSVSIEYKYAYNNYPMLLLRVQDNQNTTSIAGGTQILKHLTGYGVQLITASQIRIYKFDNYSNGGALPTIVGQGTTAKLLATKSITAANWASYEKVHFTSQVEQTDAGVKLIVACYGIHANGYIQDVQSTQFSYIDTTYPILTSGTAGVALASVTSGSYNPIIRFSYTGFGTVENPEGNEKMLRVTTNNNSSLSINGLSYLYTAERGVEYFCSFNYKAISGDPVIFKAKRQLSGSFGDIAEQTEVISGSLNHYNKVYKFTVPDSDNLDTERNLALVFEQSGAAGGVADISNLRLWKADDATQTNLLSNGDFTKSVPYYSYYAALFTADDDNWGIIYGSACPDLELIDVPDEDYFPAPKRMVHINRPATTGNPVFGQNVNIENGKTYRISYYSNIDLGALNSSVFLRIKFAWWSGPNYHVVDTGSNNHMTPSGENSNLRYSEFTFTANEESAGNRFAGFEFLEFQSTEMYIYDFKIVDVSSPDVNLFQNSNFADGLKDWRCFNIVGMSGQTQEISEAGVIELLPYDEGLFIIDLLPHVIDYLMKKPTEIIVEEFFDDPVTIITLLDLKQRELELKEAVTQKEAAADAMRESVLNSDDHLDLTGKTCYYISPNGNNDNNGTTPATAFKTPEKLDSLSLDSSDAVLFERGMEFYLQSPIMGKSGVTYAAYGEGDKPVIYGSPKNFSGDGIWTGSGTANVWKTNFPYGDAGVFAFNHGEEVGIKRRDGIAHLTKNNHYYHNEIEGVLYLYCDKGNPGNIYENIHIGSKSSIFILDAHISDVIIDNLCLKYAGEFAINCKGNNNDVTITNCEIGWIGGSRYNETVDYGNAIQFWSLCKNVQVENCWIYQIFDVALTFQGRSGNTFQNVYFKNNLLEYNDMDIEFWDNKSGGKMLNIHIEGNHMRFAGWGWGTDQAVTSYRGMSASIRALTNNCSERDISIKKNVFDGAKYALVRWDESQSSWDHSGIMIEKNIYFLDSTTILKCIALGGETGGKAKNQFEFEAAVSLFDSSPDSIKWLGK